MPVPAHGTLKSICENSKFHYLCILEEQLSIHVQQAQENVASREKKYLNINKLFMEIPSLVYDNSLR